MPRSVQALVSLALADRDIGRLLADGDWYLTGSRAAGLHDDLSDWDTIVLSRSDPTVDQRAAVGRSRLDTVFGIVRSASVPVTLDAMRAQRRAQAVEINVYGPAGRAHRASDGSVIWAYDLRHAVALQTGAGVGEPYRQRIADAFEQRRATLCGDAYLRFRMARNESAQTLSRSDPVPRALTTARCVRHAARFWLLAGGEPYPADKWLVSALARDPAAEDLVPLMRDLTDATADPATRFEAVSTLWRLVDARAEAVGVDPELLSGSPFVVAG